MRWLMIALLVSLTALLIAAAGLARHIWMQRRRTRSKPSAQAQGSTVSVSSQIKETDVETKV
jgi:multidrug resistance efflux pump